MTVPRRFLLGSYGSRDSIHEHLPESILSDRWSLREMLMAEHPILNRHEMCMSCQ